MCIFVFLFSYIYFIGDILKNFFIGILIGSGAILPGISSGVFCVIFGLYEKLIHSVLYFFKDIKNNFKFLFPIASGALISIFLLSHVLQLAFDKFNVITSYVFMGLILGSLPLIIKQSKVCKITLTHIMCFIITLLFSIYLVLLEHENLFTASTFSTSSLVLIGFLMSAGIIIPGVSKTAILMLLGIYSSYLSAIASLNFSILIPMGIGLFLGGFTFMFVINFLFSNFKSYTYFLILGFVVGSAFVLFPGFKFSPEYIGGIFSSVISFVVANKLSNLERKSHIKNNE